MKYKHNTHMKYKICLLELLSALWFCGIQQDTASTHVTYCMKGCFKPNFN